jgi:hypothetical protein
MRDHLAAYSGVASEAQIRAAEWLADQIESDQELLGMLFRGELAVTFDGDEPIFDVPCTTEASRQAARADLQPDMTFAYT